MEQEYQSVGDYSKYSLTELETIYARMQDDKFSNGLNVIEGEINKKKTELDNLNNSKNHYNYYGFWESIVSTIINRLLP